MMGSPRRLDNYHQEELHGLPPLDLATNQILNYGGIPISNANGDPSLVHEMSPVSSQMIQELGFHWPVVGKQDEGFLNQLLRADGQQLSGQEKLKEELLDCSGLRPLPTNLSESHYYYYNCVSLEAPDLLASSKSGRSIFHPSVALMKSLLGDDGASGHGHHLPESTPAASYSLHQKMPSLVSGVAEAASRSPQTRPAAPRKPPRLEQRSPFPPFKVRKEKLGDRIAALQQLVAPFGKTDTASVLMEAIGYIKFLLDQVEKLSVPYMKSCGHKRSRTVTEASKEKISNETKRDLRSRGLCLVPLSCTSYMTSEQGIWSPSNYGGSG